MLVQIHWSPSFMLMTQMETVSLMPLLVEMRTATSCWTNTRVRDTQTHVRSLSSSAFTHVCVGRDSVSASGTSNKGFVWSRVLLRFLQTLITDDRLLNVVLRLASDALVSSPGD